MSEFTDNEGRKWQLVIDAPTIVAVREAHDVDLVDISESAKVWDLLAEDDLVLFVDVLWTICAEQCQAGSIDAVSFAKGLDGDALGDATDALVQAISNFIPPRRRQLLTALMTKKMELMKKGMDLAQTKVESQALESKVMKKLDSDLDQAIDQTLQTSASDGQGPVESAPKG